VGERGMKREVKKGKDGMKVGSKGGTGEKQVKVSSMKDFEKGRMSGSRRAGVENTEEKGGSIGSGNE